MKRTRTERKDVQVLDAMWCDICGKEILNPDGCGFEFACLHADWGYSSNHDMDRIHVEICEQCTYEKIVPMLTDRARAKIAEEGGMYAD